MSLRNVTPIVPKNKQERAMLKDNLIGLGCGGLLERPWNLKNKNFVQQFVMIQEQKAERSNIFNSTIRD